MFSYNSGLFLHNDYYYNYNEDDDETILKLVSKNFRHSKLFLMCRLHLKISELILGSDSTNGF